MMRKRLCNKSLRLRCRCSTHRRAFSLAELIVSIGVLVLMFSLAGQVFNMTVSSTGQAKALTNVSQLLRAFERTLREDLRHVQPGRSLILIQGNPVNAYWTAEGKEADGDNDPSNGYAHVSDPTRERQDGSGDLVNPRADMLMLFTARKTTTFAHAHEFPDIASSLQQVVYGHTELGEYVPAPPAGADPYLFAAGPEAFHLDAITDYPSYPSPTDVSFVPAAQWHLGRRGVLLVPTPTPIPATADLPLGAAELQNLLEGRTDVIGRFGYEEVVLTPGPVLPWYLPDIINPGNPVPRSLLDPTTPALYANRLGHYLLPNCASFKVEWALDPHSEFVAGRLDGTTEVLWFDPGRFDPVDVQEHPLAELERAAASATDPELQVRLLDLLDTQTLHPDASDPATDVYSLADRFLGQQLQARRGFDPLDAWQTLAPDARPNLIVFGAARRRFGTVEEVPEDIFPLALRITIDVYDSQGRLQRPMRHVMVVPVGG